jgi:hypothetical protein
VRSTASPGISASSITVAATWPGTTAAGTACDATQGTNSAGCVVQVTVTYPFSFLLPAPSAVTIHLQGKSAMVVSK